MIVIEILFIDRWMSYKRQTWGSLFSVYKLKQQFSLEKYQVTWSLLTETINLPLINQLIKYCISYVQINNMQSFSAIVYYIIQNESNIFSFDIFVSRNFKTNYLIHNVKLATRHAILGNIIFCFLPVLVHICSSIS